MNFMISEIKIQSLDQTKKAGRYFYIIALKQGFQKNLF